MAKLPSPRSQGDILNDLLDGYASSGLFSINSITDLDQLRKMLGLKDPLTVEETQELKDIKEQHAIDLKTLKINMFKKQSSELRQHVINSFLWQETVNEINIASIPNSDRVNELEAKSKNQSYPYSTNAIGNLSINIQDSTGFIRFGAQATLPDGITIQELRQAHLEATLEEEILNGDK